jgi:serine/threonine protein kinase
VADIRLPGMSGLEMLELLRQDRLTATVPLILITSVGHRQIHRQGMELGADDFITKPLAVEEVTRAVDARLARAQSVAVAECLRAVPAAMLAPPERLGRFRIEKRLARGIGTELYLGRDAAGVPAAVKVLLEAGGSGEKLQRFLNEIEIAGSVRHPNLAAVLDRGRSDCGPFVAFEYFPLGDLAGMLSRGIAPHLAFRIVSQVAAGLGALHGAGIVHRDIKPANLMVRNAQSFVITDFGTAKMLEMDNGVTPNGRVVGTPTYVSPEQITRKPVGPWSDIYSLGVVLYELLAGHKPFAGADYHQVLHAHVAEAPAPLPTRLTAFQPIISRMLAKNPADRQGDTGVLQREISALAF